METEAFKFWTEMFDTTIDNAILDSYKKERKELQKTAILITALQIEIKNVQQSFDKEFNILRQQLKLKDEMEEKVKSLPAEINSIQILKKHDDISKLDTNISVQNSNSDTSYLFTNSSSSDKSSNFQVIDITLSDEDFTNIEESPTLISKRKNKSKKQTKKICNNIKKNIFKGVDKENSMLVDCTPEIKVTKRAGNKKGFLSKKTKKKSTLTQMFSSYSKTIANNESTFDKHQNGNNDTTYLNEDCTELGITKLSSNKMDKNQTGNDNTTYLKEDNTELGITKLLSIINNDENANPVKNDSNFEDEMNSMQDIDEFSKGILFDEESPLSVSPENQFKSEKNPAFVSPSPKKKFKPCESLVEPGLRGNAKKMLKGFSCDQCRNFYSTMKLSPGELQKKINECSNHRYKYQPPEDTYAGIWDLTIPEEKFQKK